MISLFYLQYPLSCTCFDPWDVKHLLSLFERWVSASSLMNCKVAWKTAILLAVVTVKQNSDLTLLHTGNQHLALQHYAIIFIPVSGGKPDQPDHCPPQIHVEYHSNVNLCPVLCLKTHLCCFGLSGNSNAGSYVSSLFLRSNNR